MMHGNRLHCGPWGRSCGGGRPAKRYDWKYAPKERVYGRATVYALPEELGTDPAALLKALGEKPSRDSKADEKRLAELIEANSRCLVLPPAALVSAGEPVRGDEQEAVLLNVLTVLAKSSGSLYLRDKSANVQCIGRARRLVLIVPPNWKADSAEERPQQKGAA